MAITRLQILNNKKSALMKQQIREIAKLLAESPPKEEKARIKAEALIRDDDTVEACEILALNCKLLAERVPLISHCKVCPDDLVSTVSTVSTLLWASYAVDIPELVEASGGAETIPIQIRKAIRKRRDAECGRVY